MNNLTFSIYKISPPITQTNNDIVAARVEDGKKMIDTHGCVDIQKNTFVVPIEGIYKIDTQTIRNDTTYIDTKIEYRRAGDTLEIYYNYISYKFGQYKIVGNEVIIKINKEYWNLPIEDILPSGFEMSPAAKVLFGNQTSTNFNGNIVIPFIKK